MSRSTRKPTKRRKSRLRVAKEVTPEEKRKAKLMAAILFVVLPTLLLFGVAGYFIAKGAKFLAGPFIVMGLFSLVAGSIAYVRTARAIEG